MSQCPCTDPAKRATARAHLMGSLVVVLLAVVETDWLGLGRGRSGDEDAANGSVIPPALGQSYG